FDNVAIGNFALQRNTDGKNNTANGFAALINNTGSNNIGLGAFAGNSLTTGSNNIDIGNAGAAGQANTIRIGTTGVQTATFIAGINGVNEGGMISAVTINSNGQLGTQPALVSSRRFKKEIKPMNQTSEAILALKPVTFQYKGDNKGTPQFGLIAEEVAQVNPDLVVRDDKGEIYTVRYEAVNAMLLNEFLKEHQTVQELKSVAAKRDATIAKQQKQIEALTTGLRKVSDQLELSKPAPQTVSNSQ
ncbi:MAG TPA: tail fiber domain-containing protein, partial [Candidatus Udaeobacter sp.]